MKDKHVIWNGEVVQVTQEIIDQILAAIGHSKQTCEAPEQVLYVVDVDPDEKVITFKMPDA